VETGDAVVGGEAAAAAGRIRQRGVGPQPSEKI